MTKETLNEKYYPVAVNTGISKEDEAMVFTLYAENWNDFDNDHYILSIEKKEQQGFVELPTIEAVDSLVKELTGNSKKTFFAKDEDGEIQGDIYGKVLGKEGENVSERLF